MDLGEGAAELFEQECDMYACSVVGGGDSWHRTAWQGPLGGNNCVADPSKQGLEVAGGEEGSVWGLWGKRSIKI